jgi:hypothetical protein
LTSFDRGKEEPRHRFLDKTHAGNISLISIISIFESPRGILWDFLWGTVYSICKQDLPKKKKKKVGVAAAAVIPKKISYLSWGIRHRHAPSPAVFSLCTCLQAGTFWVGNSSNFGNNWNVFRNSQTTFPARNLQPGSHKVKVAFKDVSNSWGIEIDQVTLLFANGLSSVDPTGVCCVVCV